MNSVQRDKCYGRRLITSGGDFGITYAATMKSRGVIKKALAAFPFIALAALVIAAVITRTY